MEPSIPALPAWVTEMKLFGRTADFKTPSGQTDYTEIPVATFDRGVRLVAALKDLVRRAVLVDL
jgi:hypothetical protein